MGIPGATSPCWRTQISKPLTNWTALGITGTAAGNKFTFTATNA